MQKVAFFSEFPERIGQIMKTSGKELFEIWFSITEIIFSKETCARLGTSPSNNLNLLRMLFHFFRYDPSDYKGKEIAEEIGISSACASDTVQKLVEDGILDRIRRPENRRAVQLTLTPQGQAIRNMLFAILSERFSACCLEGNSETGETADCV